MTDRSTLELHAERQRQVTANRDAQMHTTALHDQTSPRIACGRIPPARRRRLIAALAVLGTSFVLPGAAQANVLSISGSMEGAIQISNGDYVAAGINLSKTQASGMLELVKGTVTFHGKCSNGSSANTLVVDLKRGPYTQSELVNNEKEPASFQGSVVASVCGGGSATLDASSGATLSADVQGTNTSESIQVQFHYRDPNAKGKGNYDCSAESSASLGAAVCGASWSGTVSLKPDAKPPPPEPAFTIEKLQEIAGGGGFGFTTMPLSGKLGQTVDYEIIVHNTGNTTLSFAGFSDPKCDAGTIAGGPSKALAPGESAIYTCEHVLSATGEYTNSACVNASPPEGAPINHCSNIVIVNVPHEPAFTIEKLQKIEGPFTSSPLSGKLGQTVDYEIIVHNTGNTTLSFAGFSDPKCDAGTMAGGPSKALAPGESAIYTCEHVLSATGEYTNSACVNASPPEGAPINHCSNIVIVNVPPTTPPAPKTSVLGTSTVVPALKGPQGCVRTSFVASLKAAGVASVTFYLDGHKLKTLSAKNAHGGKLSISINVTKLGVGAHRLVAKIKMASSARSVTASRQLTFVHCASAAIAPKFTG
jgi:hypothetical protein